MPKLESMILETRDWRIMHARERRRIEAAACAIREKALCDAREAIVGRAEPPFVFRSVSGTY